MIDVERHYFSRKGGISILIGISFSLLCFSVVINSFYCYGVLTDSIRLLFFRRTIYLLGSYLLLFIIYAILVRYIGFSYPLVIGFTSISFLYNAFSGYSIARTSYSWTINYLIENPVGFEPYAERAYSEALNNIYLIAVVYLIVSVIPAIRRRTFILGRLWLINVLTPLLVIPPIVLVILTVPEEGRLDYAYKSIVMYLTLMGWYTVRYIYKALCFMLLFPSRRRMRLEKMSASRYRALVNRKSNFFKKQIPLLSEYDPRMHEASSVVKNTESQPPSNDESVEVLSEEELKEIIPNIAEELLDVLATDSNEIPLESFVEIEGVSYAESLERSSIVKEDTSSNTPTKKSKKGFHGFLEVLGEYFKRMFSWIRNLFTKKKK